MRLSVGCLLLALSLPINPALAGSHSRVPDCNYFQEVYYDPDQGHHNNADYVALLCRGLEKMEAGLLAEAIADFEAAEGMALHEVENYDSYPFIAHAALLQGNDKKYEEYLYKTEVALSLLHGVFTCDESAERQGPIRDAAGRALEDTRAREVEWNMCSAFFSSYFDPLSISLEAVVQHGKFVDYYLYVRELKTNRDRLRGQAD